VHIAAHGEFNPYNPLFSALLLNKDAQNDGRLEVHEVYGMDLTQAKLVVLSACETEMGHLTDMERFPGGDELVGLNRAFLFAGTPTVVGSLWRVDDAATLLLMEQFYMHLQEGQSKAAALRQAQMETRERYPHPYYWAGFVLVGDGYGRVVPDQRLGLWSFVLAAAGLVLVGSVGGGWARGRRRRVRARQALEVQLGQLLDARQRLSQEPESIGCRHAMQWISKELRDIGRRNHELFDAK
jgi:hypothetical protein